MMEDRDIERAVLEASEKVVIETTAKDILKRYEDQRKERRKTTRIPWYRTKAATIGVPIFCLVAIVATTTGVLVGLRGSSSDSTGSSDGIYVPTANAAIQSATYEILAGVSFLGTRSDAETASALANSALVSRVKRRVEGTITQSLFSEICSTFEDFRFMLDILDDYAEGGYSYTPVESDDPDMPYCVMVDDLYIYFQDPFQDGDETYTSGYVSDSDGEFLYSLTMEKETEVEGDESEVETEISLTDTLGYVLTVGTSSETEPDETSREFSIEEKDPRGRTITEVSFEAETEGRYTERTLEVEMLDSWELEWEYTIVGEIDGGFSLAFESDDLTVERDDLIQVILDPLSYTLTVDGTTYTWPE